jgi:hypothetical protein
VEVLLNMAIRFTRVKRKKFTFLRLERLPTQMYILNDNSLLCIVCLRAYPAYADYFK